MRNLPSAVPRVGVLSFLDERPFSSQCQTIRMAPEPWGSDNGLYCTFSFVFVFNENDFADAYCVWDIVLPFFLF